MKILSNKTYKSFKDTIIELEEIVHKLNEKNREYEKRIEYLYSNEYLQQVLFERDFLQNIVDDKCCIKEIDGICQDCMHKPNIKAYIKELEEEIERLNNILDEIKKDIEDIKSNYFKRYDDEVYKLCDKLLERIEG